VKKKIPALSDQQSIIVIWMSLDFGELWKTRNYMNIQQKFVTVSWHVYWSQRKLSDENKPDSQNLVTLSLQALTYLFHILPIVGHRH
jgi:hypothetical protein